MNINDSKEQIEAFKKDKKYPEALKLLSELIADEEKSLSDPNFIVSPYPYEQYAIILRNLKDHNSEIEVLERFVGLPLASGTGRQKLYERLFKVYELTGLVDHRIVNGNSVLYHKEKHTELDDMSFFKGNAAFIDVETTGLSGNGEVVELAIVLVEFNKYKGTVTRILDEYSGLRMPNCRIDPGAMEVHGLTPQKLRGKKLNNQKIKELLSKADYLIAHNASFDRRFVNSLFPETRNMRWLCSMNGVKWNKKGFKSKKLETLLKKHKVNYDQSHRALDDVKATIKLQCIIDKQTEKPYFAELITSKVLSPPRAKSSYSSKKTKRYIDNAGDNLRSNYTDDVIDNNGDPARKKKSGCSCLSAAGIVVIVIFLIWMVVM